MERTDVRCYAMSPAGCLSARAMRHGMSQPNALCHFLLDTGFWREQSQIEMNRDFKIMNMNSFFSRFCYSQIFCVAAAVLVVLASCSLTSCGRNRNGEILDATKSGGLEKVKVLLNNNPDLVFCKDTNSCTPLFLAAIYDHKDVAELLLANKADVNARTKKGQTPLHFVAIADHTDMAELLLGKGADVNAKDYKSGWTPLHFAARTGNS